MSPRELDKLVARTADTPGLQISAADVSRVRSVVFKELAKMPAAECAETISNCLRTAEARLHDEAVSDGG